MTPNSRALNIFIGTGMLAAAGAFTYVVMGGTGVFILVAAAIGGTLIRVLVVRKWPQQINEDTSGPLMLSVLNLFLGLYFLVLALREPGWGFVFAFTTLGLAVYWLVRWRRERRHALTSAQPDSPSEKSV